MKRPRLWLISLLTVSALLLSGEGSALPSRNINPSPRPTQNANSEASNEQDPSTQSQATLRPLVAYTSTPLGKSEKTDNRKQTDYQSRQDRWNRLQAWFNGFLVFFTAVLALIGFFQYLQMKAMAKTSNEATRAAQKSAAAAKASVEIADRALHLDRPYLRSNLPEMKLFYPDSRTVYAVFNLKNWGKSPAFVNGVNARLSITAIDLDLPTAVGEPPRRRDFPVELSCGEEDELPIVEGVIEPSAMSGPYKVQFRVETKEVDEEGTQIGGLYGRIPPELFKRLTEPLSIEYAPMADIRITLQGIVRYRHLSQKTYVNEFSWYYCPAVSDYLDPPAIEAV